MVEPLASLPFGLNTTVGALVNDGKIYSWSNITAPTLSNNGLVVPDSFDNGRGYFSVSYDNSTGNVIITAEAVPEPGTVLGCIAHCSALCFGGLADLRHEPWRNG